MTDYDRFIAFQAARNWSIGLAALVANESNRSQTDNKFREYAACSIAGAYSDYGPYPAVVCHGVDGLLVADGGWTEAITALVRDPVLLRSMREAARRTATARYEIGEAAHAWSEVMLKTIRGFERQHFERASLERAHRRVGLNPLLGIPARLQGSFREGGVRLVASRTGNWLAWKVGVRSR